ncbi:MAG: APC family permease [Ilumatobacteraceae bacterium]
MALSGDGNRGLRRELSVWEVVGLSVALMAPAMAVNINPQATASVAGRAVPTAFAIATVGAMLVALCFARLTQRYRHAGSVYAFVGVTLGPRHGIAAGWMTAGAYLCFGLVTAVTAGRFLTDEVRSLGVWRGAPDWLGFVLGVVAIGVACWVACRPARRGGRLMLAVEGITVTLILVVIVVVITRLVMHTAPGGHGIDMKVFVPTSDRGWSDVFLGVVFGFLSFAGFEAAASLGEETSEPRRDIPRALLGTVLLGGAFFVLVTAVQMMAFGTDPAGVEQFAASPSLMGDLAEAYVAGWVGHVITLGATASAVSCATAAVVAASRLVFALSRDGVGPSPLRRLSGRHVPARAAIAVTVAMVAGTGIGWAVSNGDPFAVIVAVGTGGTLLLLVAYALVCIGSARLAARDTVIGLLGLVAVGYTVWRNLWPLPVGAAWWGPAIFLTMLALAVGAAATIPGAAAAGRKLLADEGLSLPAGE